jgi:putative transposase
MPRQSRIDAPGALHHVVFRGIEKSDVFRRDTDSKHFLERMAEVLDDTKAKGCLLLQT